MAPIGARASTPPGVAHDQRYLVVAKLGWVAHQQACWLPLASTAPQEICSRRRKTIAAELKFYAIARSDDTS